MTALAELIEVLTPDERREVDEHLAVIAPILPHTEYQSDPIGWARDKLLVPEHTLRWSLLPHYDGRVWDGTPDPLAVAFEAIRDWKHCAIESGTGTGKSFGVAILILWFLACWENAEVYTFALNEEQLKLYIWKNITELWPRFQARFPTAELSSLTIRMRGGTDERWSAHGRPVALRAGETVATRAAGMHAEHMLLVYEEMAGMDKSVPAAGKNTCTAPHNLRIGIGNPNHQLDTLHLMTQDPRTVAVRMSALDHPNVVSGNASLIPGAVSQISIDDRVTEYGVDDPIYQSRVRGVSPEQAANALIRLEWLKAAAQRYEARKYAGTLPTVVTGKGVDVANSEHGDRAAIVDFCENVWTRCDAFQCPDSNQLGRTVFAEMTNPRLADPLDPTRVGVDAIGVGAGTVNELRRLGKVVMAIYNGSDPVKRAEKTADGKLVEWSPDVNRFKNLRGQTYWQAREDLRLGRVDGPKDQGLWEELTSVTFEDDGKQVTVQPKVEVAALLGRSPDKADAWVMANWCRKREVKPVAPERVQGTTAGYDYASQRPREKVTAVDELRRVLERAQPNVIGSRYSIPSRRGR